MSITERVQHHRFESRSQEAVVSLLVAAAGVQQHITELMRGYGLTHDQYNVLRILRGAEPEGHPRGEVGKRMMSKAPDVTRILDRLEAQGLIVRGFAPDNRRLSVARITQAGLDLLTIIDPELHVLQQRLAASLSSTEQAQLARLCAKLVR